MSLSKAIAQILPPTPNTYLTDKVSIIEANYYDSITNVLADLEDKTGVQFLVYIDKTLYTQNLEDYSNKLFNHWKLGQKGKDNGILLTIFFEDRKFRFEIGYGLEDRLPDLRAANIQNEYLIPEFKNQNYGYGLLNTVKAISDAVSNYYFDYFGEKKQVKIDSLIIADKANALNYDQREDVLQYLKSDYFIHYPDDANCYFYFYTSKTNNLTQLKKELQLQWDSIIALQPEIKSKALIGISTSAAIFAIEADATIKKEYKLPTEGQLEYVLLPEYLINYWTEKDYYQVFSILSRGLRDNIEYNSFKKTAPIYTFFFDGLYDFKNDFIYDYYNNLIYSAIAFVVITPVFLIFILSLFATEMSWKVKSIVWFWAMSNNLLLFVLIGYILNIILLSKVFKVFRKKENWQNILKTIETKSYFGNLIDFFKMPAGTGGGGSGKTYSSGSSWKSSSSSSSFSSSRSSSSSSSSSSSRSFSGGGGGRSGGGGSSGSW
jgi:uncharacterized membrane protein YgcG